MNGYDLSRNFWNWAFDNPEKISPNHCAIYFFAVEHCNRLGWKLKFGFPSQMTMDAIGIKKHSTYIRYFNDLVEFGFFELIQKSKNQYSSNIISLVNALPKIGEAMDKAMLNHRDKQSESNRKSKRSINKQLNNKKTKQLDIEEENTLHNIETLKKHYLSKDLVLKAVVKDKRNKVKNLEDLKSKLDLFCSDLIQQGRNSEKWLEFTKYFINALRFGKFDKKEEETDIRPFKGFSL